MKPVQSACLPLHELLACGRAPAHALATTIAGEVLTWQQWTALIAGLQPLIANIGIGPWGVYCEDAAHAGAALFALWHAGSVAWLPGNVTPETVNALDQQVIGWISDVALTSDKPVISVAGLATALGTCRQTTVETARISAFETLDRNDTVLYVFTSGSSGEPKAIPKRLSQLQAELDNLQALWGQSIAPTTLMSSVSHQHVYGLLFRLLWPLANGCIFLRETIQYPEQWHAATQRLQPVTWVASPALYKRMQAMLPWSALQGQIAAMFCSGGILPAENADFLREQLQQSVIEVFGSSETGGIGWRIASPSAHGWTCFNGVMISLTPEGALRIQSPYLPDLTPFEMGDSAQLLDASHFLLSGRLDRIVKIEEKRVSLPQLEQQLATHPWVQEAHLLPLAASSMTRQSLGAVVVLGEHFPGETLATRKQVTEALRQHMAKACEAVIVPKKWRFVTEIPTNAQGKRTQQQMNSLFDTSARVMLPEVLRIDRPSVNEMRLTLAVPSKLAYFNGHFDKAPILPGVVQIDWAWQLAQPCWQLPEAFSDLEVLKFQRVITPLQLLQLSLRFDTAKQKLYFQYQSGKGTHSSGRIALKPTSAATASCNSGD